MMINSYRILLILLKAYVLIGFIFFVQNAYSQHQFKADSLIKLLETDREIADTLRLEILRGIYKNHTNPNSKLIYANESLKIAIKIDNLLWMYRSSLHIGHAHKKKGNLEECLKAYINSLKYAKEMGDKRRESIAYSAIGSVYRVQENYSLALTYYNLGIVKFREINDSTNLAKSLMNTGELYRTNHILDTALLYFAESGNIFDLINYKIGNAYNLGNIGLVYAEQGKHILAEENILKATAILEELGDHYPIAVYNTYMADIYQEKGDMPRALAYAQNSYNLAIHDGLKEQIKDASHKLSELYGVNQDFKSAYQYQEEYLAYRDSINSEETIRKMADLRTEYEVAQKQIEVDLLNQEQKTERTIGAGLISLLVMIGALAFVLNKRNKEKRLTNKILTEQKEQLELQHDELAKLNITKDRFFSIISHDLRGPVSAFKGLSTLINYCVQDKNYDELPKLSNLLDSSSNQLSLLLDNLLAWAVNQRGEFPYHPQEIDVRAVAIKITGVLQNMAESKEIALSVDIKENLLIWSDYNSTRTIIRNLVSNAIKFTQKGGTITLHASLSKGFAEIKVTDNGIGISKEKVDSLFQLNEKKSTLGTEGEKGIGLGIQLAYEFTEMNKGSLTVESEEGVGTTFRVKLPLFNKKVSA